MKMPIRPVHVLLVLAALATSAVARWTLDDPYAGPLTVTATNDPNCNVVLVYSSSGTLLQSIPTFLAGNVSGNAWGIRATSSCLGPYSWAHTYVAVVNYQGGQVSILERTSKGLVLVTNLTTSSPPVSVDFGADHLYVAGDSTVDSFAIHDHADWKLDGTVNLELGGDGFSISGPPPAGVTAQVGYVGGGTCSPYILVTLKNGTGPGAVNVISLTPSGVVKGLSAVVAGPPSSETPFGFSPFADGTAVITLAHSNQVALFANAAFGDIVKLSQNAPCWSARWDHYVFTTNPGSKSISRLFVQGDKLDVDGDPVATLGTGPTDVAAGFGYLVTLSPGTLATASTPLQNGVITWYDLAKVGSLNEVTSVTATGAGNGIEIVR